MALYDGDARVRGFSCWDQYLTMAFAQLTYRESLRDVEACLRAVPVQDIKGIVIHVGQGSRGTNWPSLPVPVFCASQTSAGASETKIRRAPASPAW